MKKLNWNWRCLAVVAAAMMFTNVASAGVIGEFEVSAFGDYVEDGDNLFIEALVTEQSPDLGFEVLEALWQVDEFGDPDLFDGTFTLSGAMGELHAVTAGAIFHGEFALGFAGEFTITGGTGAFDGVSGGGVIAGVGVGDEAGVMYLQLAGVIVPTPGALTLFGAAGLVTVTRRRRRA